MENPTLKKSFNEFRRCTRNMSVISRKLLGENYTVFKSYLRKCFSQAFLAHGAHFPVVLMLEYFACSAFTELSQK